MNKVSVSGAFNVDHEFDMIFDVDDGKFKYHPVMMKP